MTRHPFLLDYHSYMRPRELISILIYLAVMLFKIYHFGLTAHLYNY